MGHRYTIIIIGFALGAGLFYLLRDPIWQFGHKGYLFFTDRKLVEEFITSFGWGAPLVFMGIQIFQVLLAPIPGEATGFLGGYLFGSTYGFIYSTLALAVGSLINFGIGRFLGDHYVHRMISKAKFDKFDRIVRRQGIVIIFLFFVFPGFPKDWLSLFLGITTLPMKVFLLLATVGRMPGTLLLSLQGGLLFERNYTLLMIMFIITLFIAGCALFYREKLYNWVEKSN